MEVYRELANAVVVQAAADYRTALRQLKRNPTYKKAIRMRRDCERFSARIGFSFSPEQMARR